MKTLKCTRCGKEIKGGFYNAPSGASCCECWDKVPQKEKNKELEKALSKLASIGRNLK